MSKKKTMVPAGWFKWERPGLDFPFYNDKNTPMWHAFLLMGSTLVVVIGLNVIPFENRLVKALFTTIFTAVPFLIVARGNLGTIVKKPQWGDIPLVLITLLLGLTYAIGMGTILVLAGLPVTNDDVLGETMDAPFYVMVAIQLIGEELIKINMFLGCLTLFLEYTGNRKLGIVVGTLISVILFGLAHMHAYSGSVLQIVLIQGLGSVFCMFCYLKTKNFLPGYAYHLINDYLSFFWSATGATAVPTLLVCMQIL